MNMTVPVLPVHNQLCWHLSKDLPWAVTGPFFCQAFSCSLLSPFSQSRAQLISLPPLPISSSCPRRWDARDTGE